MCDSNKFNLFYFEGNSMKELYELMKAWQEKTGKRLLSANVVKDEGVFCCLALTNPTEVVICSGTGDDQARVTGGDLNIVGYTF